MALKKPNKDWTSPDSYRPIALLNTIGKIYEGILATRLRDAAEEHNLLPRCQMGARKNRSTESALYHIVQQIQAAWGARAKSRQVVSILSLDMAGAFDRVSHERLLENLRIKKIPGWLMKCVKSFLSDRITTIRLKEWKSQAKSVRCGISQKSVLSPILFLFFNASLLDVCQSPAQRITFTEFVNDVNLLIYGRNIKENCKRLKAI